MRPRETSLFFHTLHQERLLPCTLWQERFLSYVLPRERLFSPRRRDANSLGSTLEKSCDQGLLGSLHTGVFSCGSSVLGASIVALGSRLRTHGSGGDPLWRRMIRHGWIGARTLQVNRLY